MHAGPSKYAPPQPASLSAHLTFLHVRPCAPSHEGTWQHTKSLRREGLPCDLGDGWIFRILGHPATISATVRHWLTLIQRRPRRAPLWRTEVDQSINPSSL